MTSVYVGIDVHRKRSQVAVVGDDGRVQLNRNVVNGSQPMLGLPGGLPLGTPVAFEAALGPKPRTYPPFCTNTGQILSMCRTVPIWEFCA